MKLERKKGVKEIKITHNRKLLWIIGFLVVVLFILIYLIRVETNKKENTQIANPASVYCIEHKGKLEIRENEKGQYGVCIINGSECEEWAFFRGECGSLSSDCIVDSDCIKVQTTCCSCNMGGEEKCVSKNNIDIYSEKLKNCSKNMVCAAVYGCNPDKCSCVNGKCQ
jgi:putative hemolysin